MRKPDHKSDLKPESRRCHQFAVHHRGTSMSDGLIGAAIGALLAGFLGWVVTDASWANDCKMIGAHLSGRGESFTCAPRPQ